MTQLTVEVLLSPFDATWSDLTDAATTAEELGVTGVWMMDHLTGSVHDRNHVLECFAVLGGLATVTERPRLGTLAVNCAVRNPALLAQAASTVHHQSRGRFVLGLGAGGGSGTPYATEMEVIGIGDESAPVRRTRVSETVDVVEHLWVGTSEAHDGDHYTIGSPSGFLRPDPAPQLLVAGFGPKMARLAGARAAAFNTYARHPDLGALLAVVRETAEAAGRARPETSVFDEFSDDWLDPSSEQRNKLTAAGVDTLILTVPPPFDRGVLRAIARS